MNKITFIVAVFAFGVLGWLYMAEHSELNSTRADAKTAADDTAAMLSKQGKNRNPDTDAKDFFRSLFTRANLDNLAVWQSQQPLPSGQLRQTVVVSGRARTNMSNNFGLEGAEIEVVGMHDFDPKK